MNKSLSQNKERIPIQIIKLDSSIISETIIEPSSTPVTIDNLSHTFLSSYDPPIESSNP